MKKIFFKKFFTLLTTALFLFNNLFGAVSYAQEVSPEPTPVAAESPIATPSPEPSPTFEPVIEATLEPTLEPMEETITPEPSVLPVEVLQTPDVPSPDELDAVIVEDPNTQPSSTPETVEEVKIGEIQVTILENTDANSLEEFDFDYQETGSATLITDKADYAPTDTVLITGSGFLPNYDYSLEITSETGNFRFSDTVTSDESGGLFYTYQLDGTYRPNYKVEVMNQEGNLVAQVTFTDDIQASIPFSDSFGGSNSSTVTNWDEANPAEILGSTSGEDQTRDSTSGNKFAKLGEDGWMRRTINATGYNNLVLKYYWKGDNDAESSDRGRVEYCLGATCTSFTELTNHQLNNTSWSSQQSINLPSSLNNSIFRIRFRNDASSSDEYFRVDQVEVNGSTITNPDLVVTKTNNVGGNVIVGQAFIWTLKVVNEGSASVTFDNQDILEDDLPSGLTFADSSNLTVTTSGGVTGSIDCDINSNTLVCDDNNGGTSVVIPTGGSFSVSVEATSSTPGTLVNPRSGGGNICKVDPDNLKTELSESNNNCSDTITVSNVQPLANPTLGQSCGLDIALVIDGSGSIDSGEYLQMQGAFVDFVNAFLPGTPTEIAIVEFASGSVVRQGFTNNNTTLINEINESRVQPGGQYTNWKDGLVLAHGLFANRVNPDLIVFASDGNPNRPVEATALTDAITEANAIKTDGIRIITIGIGNDLDSSSLTDISSADAYYASDFSGLAGTLAQVASDLCGGTITVNKHIESLGNPGGANWMFNVSGPENYSNDLGTDANGQDNTGSLPSGSGYSIIEYSSQVPSGYSFLSASCSKPNPAGGDPVVVGNSFTDSNGNHGIEAITVNNTDIITCDFINTQHGSISGNKFDDINGDGIWDDNEQIVDHSTIENGVTIFIDENDNHTLDDGERNVNTDENGHYIFEDLVAQTYDICEVVPSGWMATNPQGTNCQSIELTHAEDAVFDFGNYKLGQINICKVDDYNGDGIRDDNEATLSGVTITLERYTEDWFVMDVKDTGEDGCTLFDNLELGTYRLSEELSDLPGYLPTNTQEGVSPEIVLSQSGQIESFDFLNELQNPVLDIEKSSDKTSVNSSDTVAFTLTIKNTNDSTAFNVNVYDILPSGFSYVAGSATPSEPLIAGQKLTWELGNMNPGEEEVIIYSVKLPDNLTDGTYTNIAVLTGFSRIDDPDMQKAEDVDTFELVKGSVASLSTAVGGTPQVLGASTLPATGSASILLIIALALLTIGIIIKVVQRGGIDKKKIQNIVSRFTSLGVTLVILNTLLVPSVKALSSAVYIQDLPLYLSKESFTITYTAVSDDPEAISAQFYIKKDLDAWKTLGSSQSGPSGKVEVTSADLYAGEAKYFIKVEAAGVSDETSVTIDRSAPDQVSSYRKEDKGGGLYRLLWRNPSNEDFANVRIYRSKDKNFTAEGSTEVATILGSPNSDMTWEGAADPTYTYYFAIRAVDKAGNGSSIVSDPETQVATQGETVLGTSVKIEDIKVGDKVTLPKESPKEQVLGEETNKVEEQIVDLNKVQENGNTLFKSISNNLGLIILTAGVVVLAGMIIFRIYRARKQISNF